jgi:hypothetical protein
MSTFIKNTIFFIGWALSPLTFWNDAFVNIPFSYLCASLLARFVRVDFITLVLVMYWMSNGLGLYMMYASGRAIFRNRAEVSRALTTLIATVIVYSIILLALDRVGVLKPI